MKKVTETTMRSINGGAYRCNICKKFIWTYFGVGIHAFKHPGKKSYVTKLW